MKKILVLSLLLVVSPVVAQSGDCLSETGSTTTWEIIGGEVLFKFWTHPDNCTPDIDHPTCEALFDQDELYWSCDACNAAEADGECAGRDENRSDDELTAARFIVPLDENVVPLYPEACPFPVDNDGLQMSNPANPPGLSDADYCRMQALHRWLFRLVWEEDALFWIDELWYIYDWLLAGAPQGGAGYNTTQERNYLGSTVSWWSGEVNDCMGNIDAAQSAIRLHVQNSCSGEWLGDPVP
jgi:hypothetical protein